MKLRAEIAGDFLGDVAGEGECQHKSADQHLQHDVIVGPVQLEKAEVFAGILQQGAELIGPVFKPWQQLPNDPQPEHRLDHHPGYIGMEQTLQHKHEDEEKPMPGYRLCFRSFHAVDLQGKEFFLRGGVEVELEQPFLNFSWQ